MRLKINKKRLCILLKISNLRKTPYIFLMHNLKANFDKFLLVSKSFFENQLCVDNNFRSYANKPKMSDLEIIALSCTAESLSIDSENLLFEKLKTEFKEDFPNLIDRSNYNRRRKKLFCQLAELSRNICTKLSGKNAEFIVDSLPIPICSNVRINRSNICKDDPGLMPSRAYHASHKLYYYGFKLQLVISKEGFPFATGITTASMHDSKFLPILKE